ncbi:MAG: GAF domain-containing protein [Chloroflexi bacterium]|nr:GAF domain-containing protein [Chloroflexota bacterium]
MRSPELQQPSEQAAKDNNRIRTLLLFGVAGFLAVVFVEGLYYNLARTAAAWQYNALLIVNTVLAILLLLNTILLARIKNLALAAWIFIAAVNVTFPIVIFFISGLGVIFAISSFIFTLIFAVQALPRRSVTVAAVVGFLVSVFVLLVEFALNLPNRLAVTNQIQQALIIAIGSIILFTGIYVINQIEFKSMRSQLNITFLVAIIVPVLMMGIPPILNTQKLLSDKAIQTLQFGARQTGDKLEAFFQENLDSVQAGASLPSVIGFLKGEETGEEALGTLRALGSAYEDLISYSILDANGIVLLETNELQSKVGTDQSRTSYFRNALSNQPAQLSDVLFDQQTGAAGIYFSIRVEDERARVIGVLVMEYDASVLQHIVAAQNTAGTNSYVILFDEYHTVLANAIEDTMLYKTTLPLNVSQLADLQAIQRLPPGGQENLLLNLPELENNLTTGAPSFVLELEENDPSANDDQAVQIRMTSKSWVLMALEPGEVFLQPLYEQLRGSILVILLLTIGAGAIAALTSNILVAPIKQITKAAEQIKSGDLLAHTQIQRIDEIGTLANVLDQTTAQLSTTLKELEQRVAERTYDLEIARMQSEERSRNLEVISEVSRAISAEQRLDVLLPLITQTVSEKFDFYHAGIFLLDPTKMYAVLHASNSPGGQRMLARGHRLEVGQTGIVGYVAQTGKPRIALDVGADSSYFNNPDLPETHSEMALPLTVRGEVIGVLDVQSTRQGAFTDNDASSLSIMADQIAIAIENARLFERTQQALAETQAMYSQYVRQEWRSFAQQSKKIGYFQSISGGSLLDKPVSTAAIQQALEQGAVVALDGTAASQPTVVVPVKLRGEMLGVLNVVSLQKERRWTQEEIALIQTASDRLALALENARLLEDSLRRAERERRVSDITSHIRSTNDPNEMIRLAVQELKNALGVSRVEVLPQTVSAQPGQSETTT